MSNLHKTADQVSQHQINDDLWVFDSVRYKRVPGYSRYVAAEYGLIFKITPFGFAKVGSSGRPGHYQRVKLTADDGRYASVLAHTVVALTFIPKPRWIVNPEIDHKRGKKDDNHWRNLEWVSHAENIDRANRRSGVVLKFRSKEPVIDQNGVWYPSHTACAQALGVSRAHVSTVLSADSYNVTAAGLRLYRANQIEINNAHS